MKDKKMKDIPMEVAVSIINGEPLPSEWFCPECGKTPLNHNNDSCSYSFYHDKDQAIFGWEPN